MGSEHQFNDGEKENKRVLRQFKKEFKQMVANTPEGMRNPKLLTAALDFALACVKAYELDKADAVYRRVIGECRRRGMPWDVKCIQDMATLRCKQHRQAVNLKGGEPGREDLWNLGIVRKNQGLYDEALPMLEQALAESQELEPAHPVTIAKLH